MAETDIGTMVRKARKQATMTQPTAAGRADCSQGYWSDVETGKEIPTIEMLQRMAKAVNCRLDMKLMRLKPKRH